MIYLDNSATTRPCDAAVTAMGEMLEDAWYNPSALYGEAVDVERRIEGARASLARHMGITPKEVVFTSGGTEADSLALQGAAACFRGPRRVLLFAGEHPAVRETATSLSTQGHTVEFVPASGEGIIDLHAFANMLDADVAMVSCMQVGNETGAVQPIEEVGRLLRAASPQALFHVDGVQGFLRMPTDLSQLGVDLFSISAHKIHGPKGVGALAVRKGARLVPCIAGGGQEGGLRSGTENTAGIIGFAAAAAWAHAQKEAAARMRSMKLRLFERLQEGIAGLRVNGPQPYSAQAAPHILNVSLPDVGGEVMVHALAREGVLVGTGAACSSKKRTMSAAFTAMKVPRWAADSAIRISFGWMHADSDADEAAEAILRCYARYRTGRRRG